MAQFTSGKQLYTHPSIHLSGADPASPTREKFYLLCYSARLPVCGKSSNTLSMAMKNLGDQKETLTISRKGLTSYRELPCLVSFLVFLCGTGRGAKGKYL